MAEELDAVSGEIRVYEINMKRIENQLVELSKYEHIKIDSLGDIMDSIEVKEVEVSFYAPLDHNAVEGMCYSGDPHITASGKEVVIGETIAAGPEIPFGTKVYIEGYGWRTVQDRGGMIGNDNIDIAVASRGEALRNGRKKLLAIFFYPEELHNER